MKLVVTQPTLLEPDVYLVTLTALEPVQGQYGEQLKWRFTVADGEHQGATLTAWSNLSAAMNSKTLRWVQALLGEPIAPGTEVDTEQLIGKGARAVVEVKTAPDGKQYNRVLDLLPLKRLGKTVRVKDGMIATPATALGFPEPASDDFAGDPFVEVEV